MSTIQEIAEDTDRSSSPDIGEITANWSDSDEGGDSGEDEAWEQNYFWQPRRGPHKYAQRNLSLTHRSAYPLPLRQFLIRQNVRAALNLPLSTSWKDDTPNAMIDCAIQTASAEDTNPPSPVALAVHEFALLEEHSPESEQRWLEKDDILADYRTWERIAVQGADIFPRLSFEEFQDTTRRNGRRIYTQDEMCVKETAVFEIRYLATFIQLKPDGKSLDYDYAHLKQMDLSDLFMTCLLIASYSGEEKREPGDEPIPRWGVAELLHREKWIYKGFRDRFLTESSFQSCTRNSYDEAASDKDEISWADRSIWNEIYKVDDLIERSIYPGDEGKYVQEEVYVVADNGNQERKSILSRIAV